LKTRIFTTGVVLKRGMLLILRRKSDDDTYPGFWDCVGGHFEKGESAEECMLREAREESGQRMKIIRGGPLIEYIDEYGRAVAVPFLLRSDPNGKVTLSEHSEYRWIHLGAAKGYKMVPDLAMALRAFGLQKNGPRKKTARK
jgi:8-oxo-dGTP diphosphatase